MDYNVKIKVNKILQCVSVCYGFFKFEISSSLYFESEHNYLPRKNCNYFFIFSNVLNFFSGRKFLLSILNLFSLIITYFHTDFFLFGSKYIDDDLQATKSGKSIISALIICSIIFF